MTFKEFVKQSKKINPTARHWNVVYDEADFDTGPRGWWGWWVHAEPHIVVHANTAAKALAQLREKTAETDPTILDDDGCEAVGDPGEAGR